MHAPIQLEGISLHYPNHVCFSDFTATIHYGQRIAIIGRNGSGKSSLLNLLCGNENPNEGDIKHLENTHVAYVPQLPGANTHLSGGQRFQKALSDALAKQPDVLLLDEPTNHLDQSNRQSLMRMLNYFEGTLIIVSHDPELLRNCTDTLWHIDQQAIHIFNGRFADYLREQQIERTQLESAKEQLNQQSKQMHQKRMQEQQRAAQSKSKGKKSISQRKWPTVVSHAKANRASSTAGKKMAKIEQEREVLSVRLGELYLPEVILPSFYLDAARQRTGQCVSISKGQVAYGDQEILNNIDLSLSAGERLAISGDNGSGKSTLVKAILNDQSITRAGQWLTPRPQDMGYLDQHYQTLNPNLSVLETIERVQPTWDQQTLRKHLNTFLFRKNEEVNLKTAQLSGGEKARLSLAQIAANPPELLILDEVTNNLDLETRAHVIQILKAYPGSLIVISHDVDFLSEIEIRSEYSI